MMVGHRDIIRSLGALLAVVALLGTGATANAATVTWDGGAGTTAWTTPANWSGDVLPTNPDSVDIGSGHLVDVPSGAVLTVASLTVAGELRLHPAEAGYGMARLNVSGPMQFATGAQVVVDGDLNSSTGWSTIATGATMSTSVGLDAPFLRNDGFINVTDGKLDIDNRFENAGTIMSLGDIQADEYVDTGVSTVLGQLFTNEASVSGSHSFCDLSRGTWIQTAGTVTIPSTCTIDVGSYRLDAGARLRLSVHATLGAPPPAYQTPPPMKVNVAQLDGTIEVTGAWGSDLTPATRQGTLVQATARTGTPTLDVPPAVADGPDPWILKAWLAPAPSAVRFAIQDTIPPTAPTNVQRLEGGSLVHARWDAALDAHTSVAGYSYEITAVADSIPDAVIDVTVTELSTGHPAGDWFLHLRAVDTAGNAGQTTHLDLGTVHEHGLWVGGGATNDWHEGANWDAGEAPAPGADVTVEAADPLAAAGPRISSSDVEVGLIELRAPLSIDAGRRLTAFSVTMGGPADLVGGSLTATRLIGSDVAPAPRMTTAITGLTSLSASGADLRVDGSVGPDDSSVTGGSQVHITGSLSGSRIEVDDGSALTAGSISIPAGGQLLADGPVTTIAFTSAGEAYFDPNSALDATTFQQGGGAITEVASGVPVTGDFVVDGGFLNVGDAVDGSVDVRAGRLFIDRFDAGPLLSISGSLTVGPDAVLEYVRPERRVVEIAGAARIDGTLAIYAPHATMPWGTIEPLLRAAGGMSGAPRLDAGGNPIERVKLAMTATELGLTSVDRAAPYPALEASLGSPTPDGTRTLTWSWAPSVADHIDVTYAMQSSIAGYVFAVDSSAATVLGATATHAPEGTSSLLIGPGTWYLHARARDAAGNWSTTVHAGPFVVAGTTSIDTTQPTETTPVVTTPADRCSNVPGVQATLPVRTTARADGTCWTTASWGADRLWGSGRAEQFRGGRGNDVVFARGGADRLFGDAGADRLYGESGDDRIVGGPGRDRLYGGAGRDVLDARDRAAGDVVACGMGRDVALLDRGDRAARDCERIIRS